MITSPQMPDPYASAPIPNYGFAPPVPPRTSAAAKIAIALAVVAVLASMFFGALALKSAHDAQARNDEIASSSASAAASSSAAAASSTRAAQAAADAERSRRRAAIPGIEESVREMAQQHIASGLIAGPILTVTCDPVTGGVEDITLETTTFACFVATERDANGSMRGYNYHATMSWDSGRYTYGYGAP